LNQTGIDHERTIANIIKERDALIEDLNKEKQKEADTVSKFTKALEQMQNGNVQLNAKINDLNAALAEKEV